jgi:hypothetical protein
MNSFYSDHVLARSIAQERISKRESITLSLGFNPIKNMVNGINEFVDTIVDNIQQPFLGHVYCTEFSPSC